MKGSGAAAVFAAGLAVFAAALVAIGAWRISKSGSDTETETAWEYGQIRYNDEVYEPKDVTTILFMGIDSLETVQEDGNGQADALYLFIIDKESGEVDILAIDRAAMTDIDVYDEDGNFLYTGEGQICLQHGYGDGNELTVSAVSGLLYDIDIDGYVSVNMGAVPALNDAAGGITVTALEDVPGSDEVYDSAFDMFGEARSLVEGETYTLTGSEAYWYVKWRDEEKEDSASDRLERQKQYISAFIAAMDEIDLSGVLSLFNAIDSYTEMSLSLSDITDLFLSESEFSLSGEIYSLPGETVTAENGAESGFDEFRVDEDELYDLVISLFYQKAE